MIPIIVNDSIELPTGESLTEKSVRSILSNQGLENISHIRMSYPVCEVFLNSYNNIIRISRQKT